ncbi:serine beta-lactamase-like protein LACTB, mitochondrial [Lytechinus variegatus]|uniref:serine beta-lactamase-like protein LACTB, mitochondrial n=1 Tax=Lytechinus variegatus TaxID=7654 RepID=UPI001BB25DF9|nr:serine beta-lactamase-like protein LACTB, mitochondrial [Lytechinus variegatus]XP_041459792.1 serine beta-lactamase-like protein LACTB, mitochondrial [Lytechinus variegatus]
MMPALSTRAKPFVSTSNHWKGMLVRSKQFIQLQKNSSIQMPRSFSQQSYRSRFTSSSPQKGYKIVLSLGLIAGGTLTAYHYFTSDRVRKFSRKVKESFDVKGPVALCQEGTRKVERDESVLVSSRKFDAAIKRSRDLLQRAKDEVGAPGIVAAVSVDGKLVWSEGFGYADVENRTPCKPNSVFRIASISKSLAMTAVARLMEEGKLDLDKPVQEYVPSFPEKEWEGEKVSLTTRHIVSHLGGIRHYDKSYVKKKKTKTNEKSEADQKKQNNKSANKEEKSNEQETNNKSEDKKNDEISTMQTESKLEEMRSKKEFKTVASALDLFKDDPLVHKPGTKYLYTTHGFTLVSAVVEGASGQDFVTYMRTMLREMGLTNTVPDKHIPIIYNRARGYQYNKHGRLENCPYVDLSYKWAGGGYLSTVQDLIKFGNIMLYSYQQPTGGADQSNLPGFLKKDTVEKIWEPVPIAKPKPSNEYCYAMGWSVLEKKQKHGYCRPTRHYVTHSGAAMGFSSVLVVAPNPVCNDGTDSATENERKDLDGMENEECLSQNHSRIPKGIVVALYANLLDVGLTKPAEGIVEAFQQCDDKT